MIDGARLIEVIETDLQRRGRGSEGDPHRRVVQYWSKDGRLLAEQDPWTSPERSAEAHHALRHLVDVLKYAFPESAYAVTTLLGSAVTRAERELSGDRTTSTSL
jgi:hypothetical protein